VERRRKRVGRKEVRRRKEEEGKVRKKRKVKEGKRGEVELFS
jgi:hypothetical protein